MHCKFRIRKRWDWWYLHWDACNLGGFNTWGEAVARMNERMTR